MENRSRSKGIELRLVNEMASGNQAAAGKLFEQYVESIFRFCHGILGSRTEAEDAAAETFVSMIERAAEIRNGGAFAPWLYRIARNECISIIRRRRQESLYEMPAEPAEIAAAPTAEFQSLDLSMGMREALSDLRFEYREVLVLFHVENMTLREVAVLIGLSASGADKRLRTARRALRDALAA